MLVSSFYNQASVTGLGRVQGWANREGGGEAGGGGESHCQFLCVGEAHEQQRHLIQDPGALTHLRKVLRRGRPRGARWRICSLGLDTDTAELTTHHVTVTSYSSRPHLPVVEGDAVDHHQPHLQPPKRTTSVDSHSESGIDARATAQPSIWRPVELKGYRVDLKGYSVDLKGYSADMWRP
eukprot:1193301-Prorocentrum_minimum.AAC.1